MVKVQVVPIGGTAKGTSYQFVQKSHREAYKLLTGKGKPTESRLKALEALGVNVDYGEPDSISVPPTENATIASS